MNFTRDIAIRMVALAGILAASMAGAALSASAQTPEPIGCAAVATPPASGQDHDDRHDATSDAMGPDHMAEIAFDLMYIDMMIPHHESIIGLATVARHELTDPQLIAMAEDIVATQDSEILELRLLREQWYSDAEPVSMEVLHSMPGMSGDMGAMEQLMSADWQVQAFCAAADKDLAFIEQTILHHQMAIDTSEAALEEAEHEEIRQIAQTVIDAQQAEIDALEIIRAELTGEATPAR
jgi:uncharacterized protein (DUF305 family)